MTIEASGGNAANPQDQNIVDVPSFKPEAETPKVEAEAPAEQPQPKPAQNDGDEQSTEDTADAKEPKKKNGYKEKLERERQRTAELEAQLAAAKPKEEPKAAEGKPEQREDETYADYYERLADWKLDQRDKARESAQREASLKNEFADKQKNYAAKADEFKATTTDFDDVINSYDGPLTAPMQQALLDSDLGPQIAYYVAQHPEEGEAMSKMGVLALNKAIGKIEAKLESNVVDTAPKAVPKISKAPPPIAPVGKSSTNSSYDPYSSKGKDDHEEYMKWRKQQK